LSVAHLGRNVELFTALDVLFGSQTDLVNLNLKVACCAGAGSAAEQLEEWSSNLVIRISDDRASVRL
jgi:hypothetical protein